MASYHLRLERISGAVAHISIDMRSSDSGSYARSVPAQVGTKLDRASRDDTLREYKVSDVISTDDRTACCFREWGELTEYKEIQFDAQVGQKPTVEAINRRVTGSFRVFDFIGRAAAESGLTRQSLNEIFLGLPAPIQEQVFHNPEGFTNKFIEVVKEEVGRHVAETIC